MLFKILAIGDVVGKEGTSLLTKNRYLQKLRDEKKINFVVVNAENASTNNGLRPEDATEILSCGCDVITGGNHILRHPSLNAILDDGKSIIRPANYSSQAPGFGYTIVDAFGFKVLVANVAGCVYMETYNSPFIALEKILSENKDKFDISIVDIHAEATSEKIALAKMFDGQVSCVFGTHTHVQTNDATILDNGTGYITDLGMCGSQNGVLGVKTECIIHKFTVGTPITFEPATGKDEINGAIFTVDTNTKKCINVETVSIKF